MLCQVGGAGGCWPCCLVGWAGFVVTPRSDQTDCSSSPLNSESQFKIHTCVGRLNPVWEDGMLGGGGGDRMSLSQLPM